MALNINEILKIEFYSIVSFQNGSTFYCWRLYRQHENDAKIEKLLIVTYNWKMHSLSLDLLSLVLLSLDPLLLDPLSLDTFFSFSENLSVLEEVGFPKLQVTMWLAVIYNFRLALLRESDGANKQGAAVARGGISPMSSSPTYSDALHCEQKKWRHYHHLQKFSFSGVFLLVSNGVNPFESESEDICSRLDSFLPVFCALSTRQGVSCLAVTKKLQSSSSWVFLCGSSLWKMFAKGRMNTVQTDSGDFKK